MPKCVVLGAQGRLGGEFVRRLGPRARGFGRAQADLGDPAGLERALAAEHPRWIINAAAYNHVDLAETRHADALAVNFSGPAHLAALCRRRGWKLLHVSSDYVFGADALARPRQPGDPPAPLNFYGYSKLVGEEAVLRCNPEALVVRVANLFGGAPVGAAARPDLVMRFLERARRGEPILAVRGQWLNPTPVSRLAAVCLRLLARDVRGLVHLTGAGACTAGEFAAAVLRAAGIAGEVVSVDRDPRAAPRAPCTVLESPAWPAPGVRGLGDWRRALPSCVAPAPRDVTGPA